MTWQIVWTNLFKWVFDAFMVVWFFMPLKGRSVPGTSSDPGLLKKLLCFIILLLPLPMYISTGSSTFLALGRFVYRAAVYALWLWARKRTGLKESAYYGIFCWIAFTTQNNIFLTPQLSFLRWNQIGWSDSVFLNQVISLVIELVVEFIIITVISRSFPFSQERPLWKFRYLAAVIVVLCQLYVKVTLRAMADAAPDRYVTELTFYPIILQIILTAALILLDRHLSARAELEQARLDEVAARYRFETSQAKAKADLDIRQLHHDMKNHLLGIQRLTGDNEKLEQYVSDLLQGTEDYEALVETGNTMIDGLLSEKMRRALDADIAMSVAVDLRNSGNISDMDLCTLFGNALDNAIEASLKVNDSSLRSIMVRCQDQAGSLVLSVQNYYEGSLRRVGQEIATSKSEPGHGMGLSGIRRAAEKYGGIMTSTTDEYHNFILTVLIPMPQ